MGYGVVIFGKLEYPAGKLSLWKDAPVDPGAFTDTPPPFHVGDREDDPLSVDTRLHWYPSTRVDIDGDRLELRDYLDESMFWDVARHLVAAFRLAASYGGRGELLLLGGAGAGPELGFRVEVGDGRSVVRRLPSEETISLQESPTIQAIEEEATKRRRTVDVASAGETQAKSVASTKGPVKPRSRAAKKAAARKKGRS